MLRKFPAQEPDFPIFRKVMDESHDMLYPHQNGCNILAIDGHVESMGGSIIESANAVAVATADQDEVEEMLGLQWPRYQP